MTGQAYAVIDDIADKAVVYFHASNVADARRFIRANFAKAPRESLEGLTIRLLWDWTGTVEFVARPEVIALVLDWVAPGTQAFEAIRQEHFRDS